MEQLDQAMRAITLENPYFTAVLYENFYGRADKLAKGLPGRNLLISRQPHRCVLSVMPIIIRWNGWTVKRRL